jgi:protein-L-isoaspartate(D-aspartate) O-methyltransferase
MSVQGPTGLPVDLSPWGTHPGASPGTRMPPHDEVQARARMVSEQIAARGVTDPRVLAAMASVPRHRFAPEDLAGQAHADYPLPIGLGQTLSQPYIVAYMAEALGLGGSERVLEVGSGSGYMAAVLSRLAAEVFGIELEPVLAARSSALLAELGCANVRVRAGDGASGWPEEAPFDAILLSCAAEEVPPPLLEQLAPGGRLLLPLAAGPFSQQLVLFTRRETGLVGLPLLPVVFVPLRRKG